MPDKILNKLNKECRDFFWGRDRKVFPIAWDNVCNPKKFNGLGVRCLDQFNNACTVKLGWKVLTDENNLWVRLVKSKYLREEDFLGNKVRQNYSLRAF